MDGTEGKKDALQLDAEQSPPDGQETPKKEAKTHYTDEEVKQLIQEDRVARGRDAKTLTDWEASLKTQQAEIDDTRTEIAKIQEQIDQAELEAARGDPARLKELQAKKSYKTLLADLETKKKELQKDRAVFDHDKAEQAETVRAVQETQLEVALWKIGAKYKVDPVILKDTIKDLKLTTVEQAEALAKRLSGTAGERPPEGETEFNPITGVTVGGQGEPTQEQLEKMSMAQYAAYVAKRDAKK